MLIRIQYLPNRERVYTYRTVNTKSRGNSHIGLNYNFSFLFKFSSLCELRVCERDPGLNQFFGMYFLFLILNLI